MGKVLQRCVLSDSETLELAFGAARWRLAYRRGGEALLVYEGEGARARRARFGRASAYALRSVEQLRYDFEKEVGEMRRDLRAEAA
jgi:hypothetical protein